jgi:dTDP-4-dehydrorhamnose 3,5-epimerase-like enzyme
MKKRNIYNCNVIELPKIQNRAGNITALENTLSAPFDIKRVYYLYDVPGGQDRGGHAHKVLEQLVIAVSGAFDVVVNDGVNRKVVHLSKPYIGLHIIPGIWRELRNFSSGAVCLVLASQPYQEDDYVREYTEYLKYTETLKIQEV